MINHHNKTIVIPNVSNHNKTFTKIEKNTFFGHDKKYENQTYFSFNLFKSPFAKGLNLYDHIIKKSNTTINLRKIPNVRNQEVDSNSLKFEKKELIRFSFLGLASKKFNLN